jgi:hypothetical protein
VEVSHFASAWRSLISNRQALLEGPTDSAMDAQSQLWKAFEALATFQHTLL